MALENIPFCVSSFLFIRINSGILCFGKSKEYYITIIILLHKNNTFSYNVSMESLWKCMTNLVFIYTGLEFAYSQAPKYLRGVIMALYLATNGIGSYLANLLVAIVTSVGNAEDWYPEKDPNKGHFEYFFFLLGGLMMLNFLVFLYVASSYKYKETSQRNEDTVKEQDVHELTVSVSSVCS